MVDCNCIDDIENYVINRETYVDLLVDYDITTYEGLFDNDRAKIRLLCADFWDKTIWEYESSKGTFSKTVIFAENYNNKVELFVEYWDGDELKASDYDRMSISTIDPPDPVLSINPYMIFEKVAKERTNDIKFEHTIQVKNTGEILSILNWEIDMDDSSFSGDLSPQILSKTSGTNLGKNEYDTITVTFTYKKEPVMQRHGAKLTFKNSDGVQDADDIETFYIYYKTNGIDRGKSISNPQYNLLQKILNLKIFSIKLPLIKLLDF